MGLCDSIRRRRQKRATENTTINVQPTIGTMCFSNSVRGAAMSMRDGGGGGGGG